jgi:hypothetical protein
LEVYNCGEPFTSHSKLHKFGAEKPILEVYNCGEPFTSHGKLHKFGAEKPIS